MFIQALLNMTAFGLIFTVISEERAVSILKVFKHDRQCTYNVTLRRVRATIVAVEEH